MRTLKYWWLLALLVGACAIPDIEIVDSLEGESGGSASTDHGGASNHAGTKSPTGEAGTGEPSPLGGSSSLGGKATGGSGGSRPGGGSGGTSMPPAGAVAKFCNGVSVYDAPVDFVLQIGSGANMASIVATSGTCQPVADDACTPIPLGNAVPVVVYDESNTVWWSSEVKIVAGEGWIFSFYFDENTQMVAFSGYPDTHARCAEIDY